MAIPELVSVYKINESFFPNLSWVEFDLQPDKNGEVIDQLSNFKKLQHLIFIHAKNLDVFSSFSGKNIVSMELVACTGKKFPIPKLELLRNIERLTINNIEVELDCGILSNLKNLIELDLLNIKKLTNIECLLELKRLKSLSVSDCKNSFNKIDKTRFKKKKWVLLDIEDA